MVLTEIVLTDITDAEKKRFMKLQEGGLLPSQALKKLETERRLGMIEPVEEKRDFFKIGENTWFYASLGAIGIAIIYIYVRARTRTTQTVTTKTKTTSLSMIDGIDTHSLNICIQKGLI